MKRNVQMALLVLGAAVIIGAAGITLTRLNDQTVFRVLVPGVVVGLILIGVAVSLARHPARPSGGIHGEDRSSRKQ